MDVVKTNIERIGGLIDLTSTVGVGTTFRIRIPLTLAIVPALVVGHPHDPIHPAADAAMLAEELLDSQFVRAKGILEWRLHPERLTRCAVDFVEKVMSSPAQPRRLTSHS